MKYIPKRRRRAHKKPEPDEPTYESIITVPSDMGIYEPNIATNDINAADVSPYPYADDFEHERLDDLGRFRVNYGGYLAGASLMLLSIFPLAASGDPHWGLPDWASVALSLFFLSMGGLTLYIQGSADNSRKSQ